MQQAFDKEAEMKKMEAAGHTHTATEKLNHKRIGKSRQEM